MSKYRPLNSGDVLPASFIAALQEYISTQAANLLIEASGTPPTSITAQASTGSGQVALGIGGLWRYAATTIVAAHPGGAAGTYDILAVASANSFGSPDTDSTDYAFGLQIVPAGGSSSGTLNGNAIVATRKVGTVLWDGSQILAVSQTVGSQSSSRAQYVISPNPAITPQRVRGAASQTSPLAIWESNTGSLKASVAADGTFNALAYQLGGSPLAASHLANGVSGSGAVALVTSPVLAGTPTAPTATLDDNTTKLATTAFVLGQLASAGDGTPTMAGAAARGVSLHGARADHVHPTDTSRAAVASPTFTTKITTPLVEVTGQAPVFAWTGDIDTAKWLNKLGGFSLTFLSDASNALTLGTGDVTYGGRTYKPKIAFSPSGDVTVAGSFIGQGLSVPSIFGTPNFAGAATGQTAALGDNTTKLATTAFVLANGTQLGSSAPLMDGAAAVGTATTAAHVDHRHPTDTSRAPTASPTFTGTVTANADIYARGTLVRLSDGPSGRGYVEVGGDGLTYMHSTAAGTLALQGSAIRHDAGSLGFFGNAPVGRQAYTGGTTATSRVLGGQGSVDLNNAASVLRQLLIDLAALGLITWN